EEGGALRELFDRVAPVAQNAGVTVNVRDRRLARGGVHVPRVVRDEAALGQGRQVDPGRAGDRVMYLQGQLTAWVVERDIHRVAPKGPQRSWRRRLPSD